MKLEEEASLVAIPFAAGDNDGAFDKKQKNHCIILEAAAGIPGWRGQEGEFNRPGSQTPGIARDE